MIMGNTNRIIEIDTTDPAKITFHSMNYWEQLRGTDLNALQGLSVADTVIARDCVYMILVEENPEESCCRYSYKLVKFATRDGKSIVLCTDINLVEANSVYKLGFSEGVDDL